MCAGHEVARVDPGGDGRSSVGHAPCAEPELDAIAAGDGVRRGVRAAAAPGRLDGGRAELPRLEHEPAAVGHAGLRDQRRLPDLGPDFVAAGLDAELHRPAERFVELHDQLAGRIANEEPPFEVARKHERRAGLTHVGHDHVSGAREADVVGRVLRPAFRVDRAAERLLECKLIGLVQRHLPVAGQIRGAPESGDEIVREVRGADAVRFLRRFRGRARCQERVSPHVGGFVDEERRPGPAALDPRERARRASVEDGDANVGRDLIEPVLSARYE